MKVTLSINFKPQTSYSDGQIVGEFVSLEASFYELPAALFSDEDVTSLTFAATEGTDPLPAWLTFTPPPTPGTDLFNISGTYPNFQNTIMTITITATDDEGLTKSLDVTINIAYQCHSTCDN